VSPARHVSQSIQALIDRWPWLGHMSDGALANEEEIVFSSLYHAENFGIPSAVDVYRRQLTAIHLVQAYRKTMSAVDRLAGLV